MMESFDGVLVMYVVLIVAVLWILAEFVEK